MLLLVLKYRGVCLSLFPIDFMGLLRAAKETASSFSMGSRDALGICLLLCYVFQDFIHPFVLLPHYSFLPLFYLSLPPLLLHVPLLFLQVLLPLRLLVLLPLLQILLPLLLLVLIPLLLLFFIPLPHH